MLAKLLEIVGEKGLVSDPKEMQPWLTDWRDRWHGSAIAIVSPASTEEVAAVVKLCAAEKQPIFPVGGNTGLCFGAVPISGDAEKPGIVLSLRRMNRIRNIDVAANTATVDAGLVLGDLHTAAEAVNRQFPLHLGSEGSAQIGGLISTNAGGTAVVRYGPMRDLVAGLEIVLADGRVLSDLVALKKDNTGYMLRHLFIGAEGTLGIITGAVLKLHPLTPNGAHAWAAVRSPQVAVELLTALQSRAGSAILAYELVSASQFEFVRRHIERIRIPFEIIPAWSVLIELGSEDTSSDLNAILEEVIGDFLTREAVEDAFIAASKQQADDIWHVRHSVSEANKKQGMSITHDVAVRVSDAPAFIAAADKVSAELYPEAIPEVVCHLGDGNVHYILMFTFEYWAALPDPEAFALEVERKIHDVAAKFSGTFSAEHGVGRKLTEELARLGDPLRVELMQRTKAMLDPHNLMNPGVLLAAEAAR